MEKLLEELKEKYNDVLYELINLKHEKDRNNLFFKQMELAIVINYFEREIGKPINTASNCDLCDVANSENLETVYTLLREFRNWDREWNKFMDKKPDSIDEFAKKIAKI